MCFLRLNEPLVPGIDAHPFQTFQTTLGIQSYGPHRPLFHLRRMPLFA